MALGISNSEILLPLAPHHPHRLSAGIKVMLYLPRCGHSGFKAPIKGCQQGRSGAEPADRGWS